MKSLKVPNGIVHLNESKASCPNCGAHVPMSESDEALQKSKNGFAEIICKGCFRKIGITSDMMGDTRAYEL